jgi:DNA polymerase-1
LGVPDQFYIVDLHGLFWRAYYTKMNPLSTSCPECGGADPVEYDLATGQGPCECCNGTGREPTKATYLVTKAFLKVTREKRPAYFAVAGDSERRLLRRRALLSSYKAKRDTETPWEARAQLGRTYQVVKALGCCVQQVQGWEADDIIATLATQCVSDQVHVTIVSRDNDFECLCEDPRIRLYDPIAEEYFDRETILAKRGIEPAKLVEVKALTGEDGDDIPGVPGIGPVTATKLIKQYGTADAVVRAAAELTPKLRESLEKFGHIVGLARQLIELDRNVPLDITPEDLAFNSLDLERARPLFRLLGFQRWE